jgi:hypothetical protein
MNALRACLPILAALSGFAIARSNPTARPPSQPVLPSIEHRNTEVSVEHPGNPVDVRSPASRSPRSTPDKVEKAGSDKSREEPSVLRVLLPLLSESQLALVVKGAIQADEASWQAAFEAFLQSDDPELISFAETAMLSGRNADGADRIARAFAMESHPGRRATLALLLGRQNKGALVVDQIDHVLQELAGDHVNRVLGNLSLDSFEPESMNRLGSRLRDVALKSRDDPIRMRAINILTADKSSGGIRFLLDRVMKDTDLDCRSAALHGLAYSAPDDGVRGEMVKSLFAVLTSQEWDAESQKEAGQRLRYLTSDQHRALLTEEQHALVERIAPGKKAKNEEMD